MADGHGVIERPSRRKEATMGLLWQRITAYLLLEEEEDSMALGREAEVSRRAIALSEWPGGAALVRSRRYDAPTT